VLRCASWDLSGTSPAFNESNADTLTRGIENRIGPRVEVLLGIDSGVLLVRLAKHRPEDLFIGVEIKPEASRFALNRVSRMSLSNVVVVNMEAQQFLTEVVPDCMIDAIHVYFPTPSPWHLRIEHPNLKRRLFNMEFSIQCRRALRPMGTLRLVTDMSAYFETAMTTFSASEWQVIDWMPPKGASAGDMIIGTPTEMTLRNRQCPEFFAVCLARA
jgi:tRNA (guanine-N7-)-methyltransferase